MDELELAAKYPLGTEITFNRTDGVGQAIGWVNGGPVTFDEDPDIVLIPVYWRRRDKIVYVNTKNIVEAK